MREVKLKDWMVLKKNGKLFQANSNDVKWPETTLEQADFWKPKEGEWCWFWNAGMEGTVYMSFGRYSKFVEGKHEGFGVYGRSYILTAYVAPFIGEVPELAEKMYS